ncbi:DKNYY domain-containing protein [Fusobacterium periodonticum]|uniref:DKNYY domain-containing protein n=1 Tax=Fusobacterium periodonticum TaxID=860 RepID=UPI0028D74CB8|nr:DKNYY domain-containing protein [Fusobacterium periodonticum]
MKINGEDLSTTEKNVNEIEYHNSLTKIFKKIFIIIITIFIVFILSEVFFIYKIKSDYNLNQNILNNGQKYEKSIYIKYEGKIFCNSFGDIYQLKDVDIDSFKTFDTGDYRDNYIATDKNNVYLGNNIIPDLNPNRLKSLGSNYYSDGVNYYFLSDRYIRNEDISTWSIVKEYIIHFKKKQLYFYPFKKIETTKALKGIKNFRYLASDGDKVYYKGELIENADLDTLKPVDGYNDDYFYDKNNIYYKTKALDFSSNENLSLVSVEQAERTYLYDELNGNVSLEEYAFDKKYIPYQVLGIDSAHVKDLLFVSKDGIFFYNSETKEQERAGDNIFKGKVENILSSVISDDKNIYYLHSYNIYRKKRTKHGYIDILVSKNIGIFSLGEKKDWEKIKDIDFGSVGQVWRKGNKYYYFDDLGVYQLIDDVVYEIVDNASLKYLLETNNINDDTIREFVRDKKLIAFKGEEVSTASIKYKESHGAEIFLAVFLTTFFGISILIISLKWKAQKKDREKLEEERKKIEKQMEFWDNYYNNNEEKEKKEDEKIPTSYKSYDDEEEIKKEIDKIKPIVKNSNDIEGLKKREKKINSIIKNFNVDEEEK